MFLEINNKLLNAIGLYIEAEQQPRINWLLAIPLSISTLSTLVMSLIYLLLNFADINEVADALYGTYAYVIIVVEYWHILINRKLFYKIIDDMGNLIQKSQVETWTIFSLFLGSNATNNFSFISQEIAIKLTSISMKLSNNKFPISQLFICASWEFSCS